MRSLPYFRFTFPKIVFLFLISIFFALFFVGIFTDVRVGDEVYHWRFAQGIYETGTRLTFDPVYESALPPGAFFSTGPLWHSGLAFFWFLTGGVSQWGAQIYQTLWLCLLLAVTYLFAKKDLSLYSSSLATLLLATTPCILVFSFFLYTDLSATALAMSSICFIRYRRFSVAGLLLGFSFLAKRNAVFLPSLYLMVDFFLGDSQKKVNIYHLFVFGLFAAIPVVPDMLWREKNLVGGDFTEGSGGTLSFTFDWFVNRYAWKTPPQGNSVLANPFDLIKYLGVGIPFTFVVSRFLKKSKQTPPLQKVWLSLALYFVFVLFFFSWKIDIRYIMSSLPLLCMGFAAMCPQEPFKRIYPLFFGLLLFQTIAVLGYTAGYRQISSAEKEAFSYIRNNTPEKSVVVYPEGILLKETERRFLWGRLAEWKVFFWPSSSIEWREVLTKYQIDYIAVPSHRVYPDEKVLVMRGYPESFVTSLSERDGVRLIFSNEIVSVWKVMSEESDVLDT